MTSRGGSSRSFMHSPDLPVLSHKQRDWAVPRERGQRVARPTPTAALTVQLGQSRTDAAALSEYSTAAELRQWLRARSPPWDWGVPTSQIRHPKNTYVSNRSIILIIPGLIVLDQRHQRHRRNTHRSYLPSCTAVTVNSRVQRHSRLPTSTLGSPGNADTWNTAYTGR